MNIIKLILTITAVLLLAFVPAVASGQTPNFTWNGDIDNSWDKDDNWDEPGAPGAGDWALIPNSAAGDCYVTDANQAAWRITIESNRTLKIIGKNLLMDGTFGYIVVDGELIFEQPGEDAAQLLYGTGELILFGSGTVKARDVDGDGPGVIDNEPSTSGWVVIDSNVTLVGSLTILSSNAVCVDGTVKVDHADDTIVIGKLESSGDSPSLFGDGVLEASAGEITIGRMDAGITSDFLDLKAIGGTIELTSHLDQSSWNNWTVTVNNGGTLDIQRDGWDSRGGFSLSNGTIDVSSSNTATFK